MFVPKPGLVVGNRYSLTQVIGRGGMGEVWRAHDRELDSACAVKFIVQHLATDRGIRERFSREAKAVARLRSPHVVQILGVGEEDGIPYLAMELLEGETLLSRMSRLGRLPPAMTLQVVEQVGEALESAHHSGIVHRDLKPDNVWFWSGTKVFVKVLDFGVAKTRLTTESLQTATGALVGTPQYMSPEQALGNRDVDHRSDLWSLAVIAVECLSGQRPFDSAGLGDLLLKIVAAEPPQLSSFAPELPASLQEWWARALARDPRDRFQSGRELAEALRPHLAGLELAGSHSAVPLRSSPASLRESAAVSVRGGAPRRPPSADPGGIVTGPRSVAPGAPPAAAAAARSPSSVGPISSSRRPPARADQRQRTLLIAAAVIGVGVLVTAGRLLLSRESEPAGPALEPPPVAAARPTALPVPSSEPAAPPTAPEPAATAAPRPAQVRIAPVEDTPWKQALGQGKSEAPKASANAPQPEPLAAPPAAKPGPAKPPPGATPEAAPAGIRGESPAPAPAVSDPVESEGAKQKRYRDLIGLPPN